MPANHTTNNRTLGLQEHTTFEINTIYQQLEVFPSSKIQSEKKMHKRLLLLTTCCTILTHTNANEGYPETTFTDDQLKKGLVFLYVIGMLYMFVALAIVCDEFFVPSLEVITTKLHLSDDVAGATFMAAGGSAPELFTNVAGVFFVQSDVGIGTIVGSAVFNILFVIGMCSLFSKDVLTLTWWPLFRDIVFYSISLILLMVFFRDGIITWFESLALIFCYVEYAVFMNYNQRIESYVKDVIDIYFTKSGHTRNHTGRSSMKPKRVSIVAHQHPHHDHTNNAALPKDNPSANVSEDASTYSFGSKHRNSSDRFGEYEDVEDEDPDEPTSPSHDTLDETTITPVVSEMNKPSDCEQTQTTDDDDESDENNPLDLSWPSGFASQVRYLAVLPIIIPLWMTLADVRKPGRDKYFPITFIGSICWIGVFSYLMVWWAVVTGQVFGVSDNVMGLTFLAAGTSVPDLLTSVIVARKGRGDMAVSSSVGSNLFDITIGLPVPWILYSAGFSKSYVINNTGLVCSILMLFSMLVMVVVSIAKSGWKMQRYLGFIMLVLYAVFLVFALMLELGVFACIF